MYSKLNVANNKESDLYDYNRSPKRVRSVARNSRSIDLDGEQYDIIEAQQLISDDNNDHDNDHENEISDSSDNNHDHDEEEHKVSLSEKYFWDARGYTPKSNHI